MLDDAAIERYARQVIVPGIGAAGQEKLLRSTVLVVGHPRGCATASLYLRAAGVQVTDECDPMPDTVQIVLVAGVASLSNQQRESVVAADRPVCWYALEEDGYQCGIHPDAGLPPCGSDGGPPSGCPSHDAAACDAAALACALMLGWKPAAVATIAI